MAPESTETSSQAKPRRRIRTILKVAMAVLLVLLVVDKLVSVFAPAPVVGHWKSIDARQAYSEAYREVMSVLPVPTRSIDVATDWGTVRVLEWAGIESGPPVLLVPGHSSGAPMWSENLPDWLGQRTILAFDPMGDAGFNAQSTPLTRPEDQGEWVSQALAGMGIEHAHVVGHSFGGATAAMLTIAHPEQVASLTLLEPVNVIKPLPASAFFWATLTQLPVPQSVRDRALAEIGGVTVEEVQERTPMSVMIDAAAAGHSTAMPLPRELTDDEWRALSVPLRVDIAGTKSLSGGQGAVDRLRGLRPDAIITLWPSATHSLPMQERATLDPALAEFWRLNS